MTEIFDLFKPEKLFSYENPVLKSVEATHRLVFEALDRTARIQLALSEDLLDLNRKRFELLYDGNSLNEKLSAHQDLATDLGKRAADYLGELQEVATNLQSGWSEAANDLAAPVAAKAAPKAKSKKAA